jgi:hypothetical protein
MKPLTATALLIASMLALSACAGGRHTTTHPSSHSDSSTRLQQRTVVSARRTSSSRLILHGSVRCTATVSSSVQAGSSLGLTFAVRNVSTHPVKVVLASGGLWLVVRAADGTKYDTRVPLEHELGPVPFPTTIRPGATKNVAFIGKYLHVRWRGPLRITPGCEKTALPALRVGVTSPGRPAESAAVADVVAASGHLLDRCRPERAGVAVQGKIDPPSGNAPSMRAMCGVRIKHEGRFLVAQALIASRLAVGELHVAQPYEELSVHHASPFEAIAWEFVVTKDGATPVAASEADATRAANRMAPDWDWTGSQWQGPGGSRCGGTGSSEGGFGASITFISVCPG